MKNKNLSNENWKFLHDRILLQYKRADINAPDSLISLLEANCYTVTTGHQLCLFGGPQYFIHKIVSTIKLAEVLKEQHPDTMFLPVFYLTFFTLCSLPCVFTL